MFDSVNLTFISDVDLDKELLGSHERRINVSSPSTYKLRYKKEMKQR